MSKVLVLYYSSYGHIETMANAIAEGARAAGAEVDVKRVPETAPLEVAQNAHFKLDQAAPVASVAELENYDAIIVGTGTRFGRMSSQMAAFLDQAGDRMEYVYQLEKRDGFADFADKDVRALVYERTAAGAGMLRDMLCRAWAESASPPARLQALAWPSRRSAPVTSPVPQASSSTSSATCPSGPRRRPVCRPASS